MWPKRKAYKHRVLANGTSTYLVIMVDDVVVVVGEVMSLSVWL